MKLKETSVENARDEDELIACRKNWEITRAYYRVEKEG